MFKETKITNFPTCLPENLFSYMREVYQREAAPKPKEKVEAAKKKPTLNERIKNAESQVAEVEDKLNTLSNPKSKEARTLAMREIRREQSRLRTSRNAEDQKKYLLNKHVMNAIREGRLDATVTIKGKSIKVTDAINRRTAYKRSILQAQLDNARRNLNGLKATAKTRRSKTLKKLTT